MKSFKQQCIDLRKKDHTISEIMSITGRSKSSVYSHIKAIPLSDKKRATISARSRMLALKNARARKGKAMHPFKPFDMWTPDLVLLVSHLMFDGEILRMRCVYNNRNTSLITRVTRLMSIVYDYGCKKYIDAKTGVITVSFNNVELQSFLNKKAQELLDNIIVLSPYHQKELLRAFFDDEGCMDFNSKNMTRRIRGYQNDKMILMLVQKLLANVGIQSKLQGKNEVVITGKENLKKFQKEINFSKGVRLNPNRTNSIWKKNIEKRELLVMAIASYKT